MSELDFTDRFWRRHIGPSEEDQKKMLKAVRAQSLEELISESVPRGIRAARPLDLPAPKTEFELLSELRGILSKNQVFRSYIGMGYHDTITPPVILRRILENPGWYTQYTPYQAEISQGRLEALLNFQTLIIDLTGLPVANASLLDEATAAAEAMAFCLAVRGAGSKKFWVSESCHPQTIAVLRTRAEPLGVEICVAEPSRFDFSEPAFGVLLQYPDTFGRVEDCGALISEAHAAGALVAMACDPLSLCLLKSPGELGADVAIGSTQRLGVPLGFGGPHAAFFSTREEYKRSIPGRIVGVSKDAQGKTAYRLALQTREQHIRREKATSNICTAQVLLAVTAAMYATYHGPEGMRKIAERVHLLARTLGGTLKKLGYALESDSFFDTLCVQVPSGSFQGISDLAQARGINFRKVSNTQIGIALDETVSEKDLALILECFNQGKPCALASPTGQIPRAQLRSTPILTHPVFNSYHSETEMLRYMQRLESRDLSLTSSMIPLGSCTMKLNAAAEMIPVTWPEVGKLHPFAPESQTRGYRELFRELERDLAEITGFSATSLQPNAGSQGEYAGLLVIRQYHRSRGDGHRNVCLIPKSAHGTNPASAAMAGMKIVIVDCDAQGNIDVADLKTKAHAHQSDLAALMVTYPSTHGVFEESIREICEVVHSAGGQVYMDGANMNAQVGLCRPGDYGADVCHLNLHKTFCIPHGGGGPGMGPICVKPHLAPFLPSHPLVELSHAQGVSAVSAAPWGSPSILPISWMFIRLMGQEGLKRSSEVAILSANYVAERLEAHYPVLYRGSRGRVAHECIVDVRAIKGKTGIDVEDIAKRLMDYGFHAPTVSFPVPGTMMIEPTESESLAEIDRFCEAMILIREEIREVESGKADAKNNLLKNAPHTAQIVTADVWDRPYSRDRAAFPAPWVRERKFWPWVSRIDGVAGDRNLVCACPPIESYQ